MYYAVCKMVSSCDIYFYKKRFPSCFIVKRISTKYFLVTISFYMYMWWPESFSRNERGRFGALKSDSTHHFFRNTCTKSMNLSKWNYIHIQICRYSLYINMFWIRVITKLPNSEQSYKGKVKTHKFCYYPYSKHVDI
jgi:hypothetical protein